MHNSFYNVKENIWEDIETVSNRYYFRFTHMYDHDKVFYSPDFEIYVSEKDIWNIKLLKDELFIVGSKQAGIYNGGGTSTDIISINEFIKRFGVSSLEEVVDKGAIII